jgi:tetratricopeptide (TPR) repeat protein
VVDLAARDAPAVVDVLAVLRAKSLLRVHGASELPSELRFSLYESIRDYAAEKLSAEAGAGARDAAATRARHAAYFLRRFAGERRGLPRPGDLISERDNLIAVVEHALAAPPTADHTRTAAQVLLALDPVLPRSGPSGAHLAWLDAVLARPPELLEPALRANVLIARGRALLARTRFADSLPSLGDALDTARVLGDPDLEARALICIGIANHRRHLDVPASEALERALALVRPDDMRRQSVVHGYLGLIDQEAGRMAAARVHYREALRAIETGGSHNRAFLETAARLRLAFLALDEGNPADAALECEQAIALAVGSRSRRMRALGECGLALARWFLAQLDDAHQLITDSARLLAEARDLSNEGFAQAIRGVILATCDQIDDAAAAFARADTALAAVGDRFGLIVSSIYHGHLDLAHSRQAIAAGDAARALAHRAEAERRAAQDGAALVTPARIALRTLQRALEAAAPDLPADDETLLVDRDRRSIRIPGRVRWVRFGRQAVLWRLMLELCEARLRAPGQPLAADALIAAGWPGQSLLPTAAQNRLHVAVNSLRKLGLRPLIVTRDDGYLLTPSVRVRWVASS